MPVATLGVARRSDTMRGNRRGGHKGLEFGGSGEDSFVAVVVHQTDRRVVVYLAADDGDQALIPKAVDLPSKGSQIPPRPPSWKSRRRNGSRGARRTSLRFGDGRDWRVGRTAMVDCGAAPRGACVRREVRTSRRNPQKRDTRASQPDPQGDRWRATRGSADATSCLSIG